MRAVVMRPGRLDVEDRPMPVPGPGEVLVRTLACGICGSDLHLFRHAQDYYDQALQAGADKTALDRGVILGHEFVGEIVEFGEDKQSELRVGQRVCSTPFLPNRLADIPLGATPWLDGAYAEYFLLEEALLIPIPDNIDTSTAALVEPLAIGIHAINRANLKTKPDCVIIGCGPIGLAVITALAARGMTNIVAADFSARRRELAMAFGASTTTDPNDTSVFDALSGDPGKAAAVFECSGANNMIRFCIDSAPTQSEIIMAGISHGEEAFVPATAISKELSLHFVSFYTTEEYKSALELLSSGRADTSAWITSKVGLEGVADAFAALTNTQQHTKILVVP